MVLLLLACQTPTEPAGPGFDLGAEDPVARTSQPLVTGGLVVLDDGTYVVSRPLLDKIDLLDHARAVPREKLDLPDGWAPGALVLDDGVVHAVMRGRGAVLSFVPGQPGTEELVEVCADPRGLDVHGGILWVACASGEVVQVVPGQGIHRTHLLEPGLHDVVAESTWLWVSLRRTAEVLRVDAASGEILERVQPEPLLVDDRWFDPAVGWRLVAHPEGGVGLAHQRHQRGLVDLSPEEDPTEPETSPYGGTTACDGILHGTVTHFVAGEGVVEQTPPFGFVPYDLVYFDGRPTIATMGGDAGLLVLVEHFPDEQQCALTDLASVTESGALPAGLTLHGDDRLAWTASSPDLEDRGRHLFHATGEAGISCASCHPDGTDDAHTWELEGFGLRRTQPLGGGLLATAPFHWDGTLADLGALFDEVGVGRMGHEPLTVTELNVLAEWLDGLPAPRGRARARADAETIERGEALFHSNEVGCASCHAGPQLTTAVTVDVGTGEPFQVPTLLGVSTRLPVMHDGCARTLRERFDPDCGGGDAHGVTSHLEEGEIDALVAYLETL